MSDAELLLRYCRDHSQADFAALVERYLNLVYTAARRHLNSPELAQDVTQSVFIEFARCAPKLSPTQPLAAWLYVVTRRVAIDAIRREHSRLVRETAAAEIAAMQTPSASWSQVAAALDDAMETLNDTERTAIVLRFFHHLSLREVGASLGISEDTAQKRVARGLDRLRAFFVRRGVMVSGTALATDLSAHAVEAGPVGLAATIAVNAFKSSTVVVAGGGLIKALSLMTVPQTLVAAGIALLLGLAAMGVWPSSLPLQPAVAVAPAVDSLPAANGENAALVVPPGRAIPTAAAPIASDLPLTLENPQPPLGDRLEDPAYRAKLAADAKIAADGFYGVLFAKLALTSAQREEFKNLLVEKQVIRTDVARAAGANGIFMGDDLYATAVVQAQRETNDRIKTLLGEAGFGAYADYEKSFTKRMVINRLARMVQSSEPLSETQVEQLVKTWVETAPPPAAREGIIGMNLVTGSGNDHDPYSLPGVRILRNAKPLLSAGQFKAFEDLRAELMLEKAEKLTR